MGNDSTADRNVGPANQKPGGDEQKGGVVTYHDPTYTAKTGAQVDAETAKRPYAFEIKGKVKPGSPGQGAV